MDYTAGESVCGAYGGGGGGDSDECVFGGEGMGGTIRIEGAQLEMAVPQRETAGPSLRSPQGSGQAG